MCVLVACHCARGMQTVGARVLLFVCACGMRLRVCVLLSEMTSTVKAFHFINKICVLMFLQTLDILMPHFGKWSVGVGVEF